MKKPEKKPVLRLSGMDANPYAIIGQVKKALKKAGADHEYVKQFIDEATSGDYAHLLRVTLEYVRIE